MKENNINKQGSNGPGRVAVPTNLNGLDRMISVLASPRELIKALYREDWDFRVYNST